MAMIEKCFLTIPKYLKKFFIDLRFVSILMTVWLIVVLGIMIEIGIFSNSQFVAFGPRPQLSFMKVPIDTYYKYNMLIVMIVLHTFITDFIADSLSPHVLNVVQDPKTKYIPHRPQTYILITTVWALYCSITQMFAIFIAFAQLDLLIVRLVSDILANMVTTSLYLQGKEYDPSKSKLHDAQIMGPIVLYNDVPRQTIVSDLQQSDSNNPELLASTSRETSIDCNDRQSLLTDKHQNTIP